MGCGPSKALQPQAPLSAASRQSPQSETGADASSFKNGHQRDAAAASAELPATVTQSQQPADGVNALAAAGTSGDITDAVPPAAAPETEIEMEPVEEFPDDPFNGRVIEVPDDCEEVDLPKGIKYRGQWKNTLQEGVGHMKYADGGSYLGDFLKGKANGLGIYSAKDGSQYCGSFVNGKANGYGVYKFKDGSKYWGPFVDDKREGRGKEVQADGLMYIGDYVKGHKHGNGVLKAANGEVYEGEFCNSEIEGFGTYTWPDGRSYVGQWEKSRQNGRAIFRWPDGRVYKGHYKDGKINGFGILEWPDGRRYEGRWVNGLQDGEGLYWATRDEYRRALFTAGVRVKWLGEPVQAQKTLLTDDPLEDVERTEPPSK